MSIGSVTLIVSLRFVKPRSSVASSNTELVLTSEVFASSPTSALLLSSSESPTSSSVVSSSPDLDFC